MRNKSKRRFIRNMMLYGGASILLLFIVGYFYQREGVRQDLLQYKPVGKHVEVYGHRMHIYSGGNGESTVVLSAGWGTPSPYVDFFPLYEKLAGQVRFAVIDNFGYGYSELTDRKRDIDLIVEEMHEGLKQAREKPPYIMVGHSLAALESIRFAQQYPDEVKGILLIDGGSPEYYAHQRPMTFVSEFQKFLIRFGVARALYQIPGFAESVSSERNALNLLPDDLKDLDRRASLLKGNNRNITDEMRQSQRNAFMVLSGPKPLNIPFTIMTAGSFGKADTAWLESQKALLSWSTEAKQVVIEDAEHYIHQYRPDLVAEEILKLAAE
ncbi:alpha/beta fold hydrolase [Cohnella nanjingensis]|uniref:Alpha/beta hydrolase n=1 Tax=Cohnella nanjingensis TaxID=1387779 RepID=A0A7X0RKR7_9BACL|nr:alpha/beta hydrolase [Cohnella nanjingensis]MBB6669297.1 alpha/beta hydrolase [Cohnella nanjingensis]